MMSSTRRKATIPIEIGHQKVLVDVIYNHTPLWPPSRDDPGAPWVIEIVSGTVLAKACDGRKYAVANMPAPDWLLQAINEDIIDGGPVGDLLIDDALAMEAA